MTLPTSGSLTLSQIQTEFGGAGTLGDYVRGGAYVPSGTAAGTGSFTVAPKTPNAGPLQISTAVPIQMSEFYGTQNVTNTITINGLNCQAGVGSAPFTGSSASISINQDGTISRSGSPSGSFHYSGPTSWNSVNGGSNDYSGVYTLVVTSISVTNFGSTYSPTSAGTVGFSNFTANCPANKSIDVTWHVDIRAISGGATLASFTVGISLDNT